MMQAPALSVVVPMFNEAAGIVAFVDDLRLHLDALGLEYEVVFVDDGSVDATYAVACDIDWPELRVIHLARNVGHQVALDAGLSVTSGSLILTMDGDGQHPSALISDMVSAVSTLGVDVVYTAQRSRSADGVGKRAAALGYYRTMRWLTGVDVGDSQADFRLVTRRVLDIVELVPGDRVLRMLLPSIGFDSTCLEYDVLPRIAGKGRFGVRRQVRLAMESAVGYSAKPLRMVATAGFVLSLAAIIWMIGVVIAYFANQSVAGWTSVMTAVLLVGGLTLLSLSVVGAYVARIHDLIKRHPRYFISEVHDPSTK